MKYNIYLLYLEMTLQQNASEEWTLYNDEDGVTYYYNNFSGVSQYENPWEEVT